jgi:phosphatidyl-myo-inositol dimannoside synthase
VTDRPRVLLFSWFYLPYLGGSELFVKAITERLRHRFDFTIVTSRLRRSLPAREGDHGVRVERVGLGAAADKFLYLAAAPTRALRLGRFDLVHSVMVNGAAFAARAFLRARRRPSLLTLQDGDSEAYLRGYLGPLFPAFPSLHRGFDRVHAISSYLADRAVRYGVARETISVVPNGCDAPPSADPASVLARRKALGLPESGVVVSVSRLVVKNGIDRLIQAFPAVVEQVPGATLLLVGEGEARASLEAQASGLRDHVRFVGAVAPEEVAGWLRLADVFARPSLSEGLGTSFLEAMACGLPVVGSRAGGIPDFLREGETGLFCDPEAPATISTALIALLRDPERARRIGASGRRQVEEGYRWDVIAERIGSLYDGLLKTAPGAQLA